MIEKAKKNKHKDKASQKQATYKNKPRKIELIQIAEYQTPIKELSLMQWSPTQQILVGVSDKVYVWNYDNSEIHHLVSYKDNEYEVTALTFHPNGD